MYLRLPFSFFSVLGRQGKNLEEVVTTPPPWGLNQRQKWKKKHPTLKPLKKKSRTSAYLPYPPSSPRLRHRTNANHSSTKEFHKPTVLKPDSCMASCTPAPNSIAIFHSGRLNFRISIVVIFCESFAFTFFTYSAFISSISAEISAFAPLSFCSAVDKRHKNKWLYLVFVLGTKKIF